MRKPRTIKEHHRNVGALRCVVTGSPNPTLHHCHSGSLAELGFVRGVSQRGVSEALVIPLKADFHCFDARGDALDGGIGIETWESWYGSQVEHLREVSDLLGYDLFRLAKEWKDAPPKRG